MSGRVVVLGGYGAVGREVVTRLEADGDQVVVADRDARRAVAAAAEHADAATATVDLSRLAALTDVVQVDDIVVNCTGVEDLRVARVSVEAGAHYVDITASTAHLDALEALNGIALSRGRTVLGSVGLAPGLTNLLAADIHRRHPDARPIDITVLLGLGDAYGAASRDWTLSRLGTTFADPVDGRQVRNFSAGRWVALPACFGRRRAYRFDLADQHTLTRSFGRPVTTRLAFDPAALGPLAAAAARMPMLARTIARGVRQLPPTKLGTAWFALRVERRGGPAHRAIGPSQSQATAAVTVSAARLLQQGDPPPGVHHLHEITTLAAIARDLERADVYTTAPIATPDPT